MKIWVQTLAIALLYAATAQLGLLASLAPDNVSIFWPPSGIALTAVLLWGRHALPGIALGALSTNLITWQVHGAMNTLLLSLAISTGSVLQAWCAGQLIKRIPLPAITAPTLASLNRLFSVLAVVAGAGLIACSVGASSLNFAGLLKAGTFPQTWATWWLGDVLGVLVFTPVLLAASSYWGWRPPISRSVLLTFGLSFGAAVFVFFISWNLQAQRQLQALNSRTADVADAVKQQLKFGSNDIESVARLFQSKKDVSRQEFKDFVSPMLTGPNANSALSAVSWNPRFDAQGRTLLEQQAHSEGLTKFEFTERNSEGKLTTAGQREEYVAVYYIEPAAGNQAALGFDIGSNPARRQAIDQARDQGQQIATAPINLVQERGNQKGFLLLKPLFPTSAVPSTPQDKRDQLRGFTVGVFRIGDLLQSALAQLSPAENDIYLFDPSLASGEQLLTASAAGKLVNASDQAAKALSAESLKTGLYATAEIEFATRRWLILSKPTPLLIDSQKILPPLLLSLGVLLLGLVLTALLLQGQKTKQANQATLFARQRLSDALDSSSDGIALFDEDTRLIQYNKSYESLMEALDLQIRLGVSFEELMSMVPQNGFQSAPDKRKIAWRVQQFTDLKTVEYRADTSAGERWLLIRHFRTTDGGTLLVLNDNTEVKATTNRLLESQKMEALGQMTGGLAHDFNNLLGIVIGRLDLLTEERDIDSRIRRDITVALNAALRGAGLVKSLLAVARRQPLQARSLDLGYVLSELFNLLRSSAGASNELSLNIESDLPAILVDRSGLESALLNLVLNARDAMPHGGKIEIASSLSQESDAQLIAAGLIPCRYVLISVTDHGQGMSTEVQRHAFDPFFTTKERGQGTGLGLAMVLGFAKQSGGTVTLSSQLGQGTVIQLLLPVAELESIEPLQTTEASPRGCERVLVVDDEPELLAMTADWLERLGYQVHTSSTAAQALEKIKAAQPPFDLLLTDVVIPGGMDGAELARLALEHKPELRVLYLSGFPEISGIRAKLSPLVEKPYRRPDLAWAVRNLLDLTPEQARAAQPNVAS